MLLGRTPHAISSITAVTGHAEHHRDPHPGGTANPAHPDPERGGQVIQAERDGEQQQGEHRPTLPVGVTTR